MTPGGGSGEPGAGSVGGTCMVAVAPALAVAVAPALAAPVPAGEVAPASWKWTEQHSIGNHLGRLVAGSGSASRGRAHWGWFCG